MKNKNSHKINKPIVALVLVFITVLGIGTYFLIHKNDPKQEVTKGVNQVNYDPPTKDEQAAGDKQKQTNADKQAVIDANQGKPQSAAVSITDASYYPYSGDVVEVRGYVSNAYEDGGICTATLVQGIHTVRQTSTGFKDATTTLCSTIDIPRNKFVASGDWQVTLSYSSATTSGNSTSRTVNIK